MKREGLMGILDTTRGKAGVREKGLRHQNGTGIIYKRGDEKTHTSHRP